MTETSDIIMLIPVLFPILAGIWIRFIKSDKQRSSLVLAVIALEILLVAGIAIKGGYRFTIWQMNDTLSVTLAADALGAFFACMIAVVWLLAGIFSAEYMKHEENVPRFFMFYTMTLGVLMGVCFSANLLTLYLFYEMMTLITVPLVIHTQTKEAISAGIKYLGYSVFGAGLALIGFFFLNTYCTTTEFVGGGTLDMTMVAGSENLLLWVYFIMMIGFGCKAGMLPLHAWLPTAHPVAPSPASAVLSGIITKGGVLAIIRTTYYLFGVDFLKGTWVQQVLLILAMATVFMGSMLAYKEKLLKKRLAYSTVSQVSYVLFGLMLMSPIGFVGALMQVVFHAIAKNTLFLSAGAIIYKTGKTYVQQLKGMGKQMPIVMWCFTIASLSLVGIPPTSGFVSKWYLAQGGLAEPTFAATGIAGVAILLISALLTAGYLLPIVLESFFPGDDFDYSTLEKKEPNSLMTVPLIIFSAGAVILGMFSGSLMNIIIEISGVIF
ncbi:MAG: proton-conducting membrane transporter [Epulopiscium sp.]|nr:proton-conducting membrane transporter [Candidatus Epulonipiscium sp.]